MAEEAKKKAEPTTFFILEEQERGGGVWHYRGKVIARDRDHAARLFYGDTQADEEITFVAISLAAWRPRVRKVAVKTTVTYAEAETFGVVPVEVEVPEVPDADPALELVPPAA